MKCLNVNKLTKAGCTFKFWVADWPAPSRWRPLLPACRDADMPIGWPHRAVGGCTNDFAACGELRFALMNNKMGGDLKKIQTVGLYMVEVWKAVGMDMTRVEFLSSSEEINSRAAEYWCALRPLRPAPRSPSAAMQGTPPLNGLLAAWRARPLVLDIARQNSLGRIVRCSQIMGRAETDELAGAAALHAPPLHYSTAP